MATQDIKIKDLPQTTEAGSDDYFIIEGFDRTNKISFRDLAIALSLRVKAPIFLGEKVESFVKINDGSLLLMDGTTYNSADYIEFWNWLATKTAEEQARFSYNNIAGTFTLPNLTGYYGEASNIQNNTLNDDEIKTHTVTSGSIQPTTQAHQHDSADTYRQNGNGSDYQGDGPYQHRRIDQLRPTSIVQVVINPFTVTSTYQGGATTHPKRYFNFVYVRVKTVLLDI